MNVNEVIANRALTHKCVRGIRANKKRCADYAFKSPSIVTALNPIIGYEKAAEIAKECAATGKPVTEIVLEKHLLLPEQIKKIFDPRKLTNPLATRRGKHPLP